jgi:hypothetical protein
LQGAAQRQLAELLVRAVGMQAPTLSTAQLQAVIASKGQ